MIKVNIGTSLSTKQVIVPANTTIKQLLQDNNVNYAQAAVLLDGGAVGAEEINMTLEELGVTESCFLIAAINTKNA